MLSMQSRYAVKALMYLARLAERDPQPTQQIAEATAIPRKFLEAILAQLKRQGIVASRMGKTGGYMLAREPDQISFADVMRTLDGPISMLPCVSKNFYQKCETCPNEGTCGLRLVMLEARDQLLSVLEHRTIADAVIAEDDASRAVRAALQAEI